MTHRTLLILCAMLCSATASVAGSARLHTPPVTVGSGTTVTLPVELTNSSPAVAVQFNIALPQGWTFNNAALAPARKADHQIVSRHDLQSGIDKMLVMVYSPTNSEIPGNDGTLLNLSVNVPDGLEQGSEYAVEITDAVVAERSGANILTDVAGGTITISRAPDFAVGVVSVSQERIVPGEPLDISWTVENLGDLLPRAGWKETIYLTDADGNETAIATTRNDEILGAHATAIRATTVTLPAILGVDETASVRVKLTPFADSGESPSATANNVGISSPLPVAQTLSLTLTPDVIYENRTAAVTGKLTRSGSYREAQTFDLSAAGFPRLSLPSSVTLPAGASQATFQLNAIDNQQLDADSIASITASGNGYVAAIATLTVLDDDNAQLSAVLDRDELTEGESATLTISTNRVSDSPVTVYITSSDKRHFDFPAQVVIPKGENSVSVTIRSIDDDVPSTVILATLKASAARHDSDTADLTVDDNDTPQIDLLLSTDKVSETAGYNAIRARLTRTTLTDSRVTVNLTPDTPGILILNPSSIILEKGVKDVEFTIGVVDNATVDGDRDVTLTAAVYVSSCSCSVGAESAGSVTRTITVIDNDGPALSVSSSASTVKEGQKFTITVSRNTPKSDTALDVSLAVEGGNSSAISLPASVTIPAGETRATVEATALNNDSTGDTGTLTVTAQADGHALGVCHIGITDQTLPDATVTGIAFNPDQPEAGTTARISVTVANEGVAPMSRPTVKVTGNNTTLAILTADGDMAPGTSTVISGNIMLPAIAGKLTVTAQVNPDNSVHELTTANNTLSVGLDLVPSFTATITPSKAVYAQGEEVVLTGKATGSTAANRDVEIYTIVNGTRTAATVTTDNEGKFSHKFTPGSGMGGHYMAGACYPGEKSSSSQCEFDVRNLRLTTSSQRNIEMTVGSSVEIPMLLSAPGNLTESGLQTEVIQAPACIDVTMDAPTSVANSDTPMTVRLSANAPSATNYDDLIKVRVTSAAGTTAEYSFYVYSTVPSGRLVSDIQAINSTMTPGQVREYPITITNTGGGETGAITVSLPDNGWMKLATPKTMASLASGESATAMLTFVPGNDVQLNVPQTGRIAINAANASGISIPYTVEPVSDTTGRLGIEVCDEYTYYTAEGPKVKGATISVLHPTRKTVIATTETGEDGRAMLELPAGYYTVNITEPNHESFSGNMIVDPGKTTTKTVNLSFQAITVDWNVEETEIEDEYRIVTTVKYETNVPMPVVVTTLPDMKPAADLAPGESMLFHAVLTNQGLITARDAELQFDYSDGVLTFESLNPGPHDIAAHQSITVPIKVTRPLDSEYSPKARRVKAGLTDEEKDILKDPKPGDKIGDCTYGIITIYAWDCGLDRKWHRYKKEVGIWTCPVSTGSGFTIPLPNVGGGAGYHGCTVCGGSGPSSNNNTVSGFEDHGCTPCQNSRATRAFVPCLKTVLRIIPATRPVMTAYDEVTGAIDEIKKPIDDAMDKINEFKDGVEKGMEMYDRAQKFVEYCNENNLNPLDAASWTQEQEDMYQGYLAREMADLGAEYLGNVADDLIGEMKDWLDNKIPGFSDAWDCAGALLEKCTKDNVGWGWDEDDPDKNEGNEDNEDDKGNKVIMSNTQKRAPKAALEIAPRPTSSYSKFDKNAWDKLIANSVYPDADKELYTMIGNISTFYVMRYRIIDWLYTNDQWLTLTPEQVDTFQKAYDQWTPSDATTSDTFHNMTSDFVEESQRNAIIKRMQLLKGNRHSDSTPVDPETPLTEDEILTAQLFSDYASWVMSYDTMTDGGKRPLSEYYEKAVALEKRLDEEATSQSSVCSSITLQLSQSMVMTRQAFRGTLTVYNGNETKSMTEAKLNLEVTDNLGNVATAHEMQTSMESLDGFTGPLTLDGGWELAPKQSGVAKVLFIPTRYAAPDTAVVYSFAGSLSYLDPFTATTVTRTLAPVSLTVKPSPVLDMTYFMQRDILADDPLTTDVVERQMPSEFSLIISNVGRGEATDINIVTEQPKIVENEKGLMIDFELLSSQLNGGDHTLALGSNVATEVGDIAPGSTAYAQWWLQSSLLGHFVDYDIKATHVTSYGNPDLSLLGDVTIHELIRSLNLGTDPETGIMSKGFLVNDVIDADDTPDMLYLTDGSNLPVASATQVNMEQPSSTTIKVTVNAETGGWVYGSTRDITGGRAEIVSITRDSDSKSIDPRNFWMTYVTLRDGRDPLYEYRMHVADMLPSASETYTVSIEPRAETDLSVASIEGLPENDAVATVPVTSVTVKFNKPVIPETFTAADLSLTRQGEAIDIAAASVEPVDDTTFIVNLGELTSGNGYYSLTVATSGIYGRDNFAGRDGRQAGWIQFRDGIVNYKVSPTPAVGGTVTPAAGGAPHGTPMAFEATPAEGYEFAGWWKDGLNEAVSTNSRLDMTLADEIEMEARFNLANHLVSTDWDSTKGSVTGAVNGTVAHGSVITITAETNDADEYTFDGWVVNGSQISTDKTVELTVNGHMEIRAMFSEKPYAYSRYVLPRGWNWITLAHEAHDKDIKGYLPELSNRFATITGEGGTAVKGDDGEFSGTLETLTPGSVYRVYLNEGGVATIKGLPLEERMTQLSEGWNHLPFIPVVNMTPDNFIADAREGEVIKSLDEFAVFDGAKWHGTLSTLTPATGYMYKAVKPHAITQGTFMSGMSQSAGGVESLSDTATPWRYNSHDYADNMPIIARATGKSGSTIDSGRIILAAFVGDKCRGIATVNDSDSSIQYLLVHGEHGDDIKFIGFDQTSNNEILSSTSATFNGDILGTLGTPFEVSFGDFTRLGNASTPAIGIYPNPAVERFYVSVEGDGAAHVTVYSESGAVVADTDDIADGVDVSQLPSGAYIVTVKTADGTCSHKLLKVNR